MQIPPELQAAPPRDLAGARALLGGQPAGSKAAFVGGTVITVAFMVWGRISYGSFFHLAWVSFGVGGFCWAGGLTLLLNVAAVTRIFRDGVLLEGRITQIRSSTDPYAGPRRKRFSIVGTFHDTDGRAMTFLVRSLLQVERLGCKEGDAVPVLHLEDRPNMLVVYTPGLGMTMAIAKPALGVRAADDDATGR
jgi:hypothetical protein